MDIIAKIKNQLASNSVLLYMKGTPDFPQCGFSGKTVKILKQCQAQFAYINIFEEPEIREALKEYSQWPTYPQLYISGELIGGCDIVMDLFEQGELAKMVTNANVATSAN